MNSHLTAGFLLLFSALALSLVFYRSCRVSLYRFRNIYLIGGITALLFMALSVFADHLLGQECSPARLLYLAYQFPFWFAHLSVSGLSLLCLLMAVSNVSLIRHEGLRFRNTFGTLLELLFILVTIAAYLLACLQKSLVSPEDPGFFAAFATFLPLFCYCLINYAECTMIGIIVMGRIAAAQKPAYDKDFIIIPGCSIAKNGGLLPLLKGRVNRAIRYAWDQEIASGRPIRYIPSGGQGPDEIMSEGSAMAFYLLSHAAEDEEVLPEKESRNTYENFLFSKRILDKVDPQGRVAFATTNYHMLRCGLLARKVGLDAEGIASSTKWYFWPNGFAREVIAIFAMTRFYHMMTAAGLALLCLFITFLL